MYVCRNICLLFFTQLPLSREGDISGRLGVAVLSVLSVCVCVCMCAANIYHLFFTQLHVYREDDISGRWEVAVLSLLNVCVHFCVPLTFAYYSLLNCRYTGRMISVGGGRLLFLVC